MNTYTYMELEHDDYGMRVDIVPTAAVDTYKVRGGWFVVGTSPVSLSDYARHGLV